jgi:PII-like signaling protein
MTVLEGEPIPLEVVEKLEALHGTQMLRCIRYHAEHDLEHRKELFALIDKVPSELQSVVMESAVHTVLLMNSAQKTWS